MFIIGVLDCPLEGEAAGPDSTVGPLPAVHARLAVVLRVISAFYAFATRPLGIIVGLLLARLALCPGETRFAHAGSGISITRAVSIAGRAILQKMPIISSRLSVPM